MRLDVRPFLGILAAISLLPYVSGAQGGGAAPVQNTLTGISGAEATHEINEANLRAVEGDPKETQAFKAFHTARDEDKKIQLGQAFMKKYPSSAYNESVYDELAAIYYSKQDMPDFYSDSETGITHFPDDVVLLVMSGWVIPRNYNGDDPDGNQKLDKAENYEKHAIDVVSAMPKPVTVSDQQFNRFKAVELATAHSGLGLIYFRREQYEDSAKELRAATQGNTNPDSTDLYALGADYHNLGRYKDAADAFGRCAQIPGDLQSICKQHADEESKRVSQPNNQ
jgi:tetratricopeptide (TPR) repeat protein